MIVIFADNRPNFTATTSRTFISSCNTSTEVSPVWGWNVPNVLDMWKLSGGQFIKMSTLSFCDWDTCLKYGVCVLWCVMCYCACIIRICSSSAKAKWTKSITVGQTMWFYVPSEKMKKCIKISPLSLLDPFAISSQRFSDFQWPFIKVEFRKWHCNLFIVREFEVSAEGIIVNLLSCTISKMQP